MPTTWISKSTISLSAADLQRELEAKGVLREEEDVSEIDARKLARDCLKEVGREMGVSR